ncbi:uncharacterized protein B0H18DRAFT_849891, partial [Fomitopsis serialis]|uniref:uncharacterized protein n=1 Tax=Fomitopsis serialis TaxID=139415 RepID=UPI002008D042
FGLLVAIDEYQSNDIRNLRGCVNDANDFADFLTVTLGVPSGQIVQLSNEQATRRAILHTFESHLINNSNIKEGDAIVFFFAGHGSQVQAPEGWISPNNKIETILPCDVLTVDSSEEYINGIPDRTFGGLIQQLADTKGNNI